MLDGAPYTITGVLPDAATAFPFPLNHQQIWVPQPSEVPYLAPSQLPGGGYFFRPIARLKPGVSLEQAREAMNVIAAGYRAAHPNNRDALSAIELVPLLRRCGWRAAKELSAAFGGGRVRAADRVREHRQPAARAFRGKTTRDRDAVGARRAPGALVRQLVSESMLLAMLGGGGGLLLAEWTLRALVASGTDVIPRLAEIRIDSLALGFAGIATLVTGLSIGLLPAMQASGVNVLNGLKAAGPGSLGSGRYLVAAWLSLKSRCRWCC